MKRFPRTEVAGVSMPRMLMGTNWILGYSHTGAAADALIHERNDAAEASRCAWTVAARHSVPIHTDPSYHYNRALAEGFDGPGRLLLEHGESTEL